MASENGHLPVVDRLLQDPRVDPLDAGNLAIRRAHSQGHAAVVSRLLHCPRVLRSVYPLLRQGALTVGVSDVAALLRHDALLRRGHLAAAVLRRRLGAMACSHS